MVGASFYRRTGKGTVLMLPLLSARPRELLIRSVVRFYSFARAGLVLISILFLFPGASRAAALPSVHVMKSRSEGIPGDFSQGRAGDILLENSRIRVVISGIDHALGAAMSGGRIIDAAPEGGMDFWGQSILMLTDEFPRQARYLEMELIEPGPLGGIAGVRFTGEDSRVNDIEITTEYLLGENDQHITIRTIYYFGLNRDQEEGIAADRIEFAAASPFVSRIGFLEEGEPVPDGDGAAPSVVYFVGHGVTYAWYSQNGAGVSSVHNGALRCRIRKFRVPGKGEKVLERRFYVIRGDPAAAYAAVNEGVLCSVTGRVEGERSRELLPDMFVEIRDPVGLLTLAVTDHQGKFRAELREGDGYSVLPLFPRGRAGMSRPLKVDSERFMDIYLRIKEGGTVHYTIQDDSGAHIPGRIVIRDAAGARIPGERGRLDPVESIDCVEGSGVFSLVPGSYRLYACHGIEYSTDSHEIRIRPGEKIDMVFRLSREVVTEGFVTADLNVHTAASLDGPATVGERFAGAVAEGLDLIAVTDRGEAFDTDRRESPDRLTVIPGEELVLRDIGRFSVFPLSVRNEIQPLGGRGVEGKTPARLFDLFRSRPGRPLVQVHAPRDGETGYFTTMGIDPVTGLSTNIEFAPGFDLLEVATGTSLGDASTVLVDWFHLLNLGHRIFGSGNSAVSARGPAPIGMPRNCIDLTGTDGGANAAVEALRAGRFFLTTGPFIRFTINGDGRPGDMVPDEDGLVDLAVDVEAAGWIDTDRVTIFANGAPVVESDRPAGDGLRFKLRETLAVYRDTWFVAVVTGDRALDPFYTGPDGEPVYPVAASNPVWVDYNGNGVFDPPGAR